MAMRLFDATGLAGYNIIESHPTEKGTLLCMVVSRTQLITVSEDPEVDKEALTTNWSVFHMDNYGEPYYSVIVMADITNVIKSIDEPTPSAEILRDAQRIMGGYGTIAVESGRVMLSNYVLVPVDVDEATHSKIIAQYIDAQRLNYVKHCVQLAKNVQ